VRVFQVYIEPEEGRLIKIHSPYFGKSIDYLPAPSKTNAENNLAMHREKFLNFGKMGSNLNFLDIYGKHFIPDAKEVTAMLINRVLRKDTSEVWSITYRGFVPEERHPNYVRFTYNAKTGTPIRKTLSPGVDPE